MSVVRSSHHGAHHHAKHHAADQGWHDTGRSFRLLHLLWVIRVHYSHSSFKRDFNLRNLKAVFA
jgi:hypothetical protein